jgi:poly(A) polymerase
MRLDDVEEMPHSKVPFTAAVLIPPEEIWEPIQAIRRAHDPRIGRWMPHVTLLYPFVPTASLDKAAALLRPACASDIPFGLTLGEFGWFDHGRWATVWLGPVPGAPVTRLRDRLAEELPWCDDTSRFEGGFSPHLSVGRWPAPQAAAAAAELQAGWQPLQWRVDRVCLIARPESDDAPFAVTHELSLGG